MRIEIAYGRDGLWVDLPGGNVTVVEPSYQPALPDEQSALREALRNPIGTPPVAELVGPQDTVAIVFSDLTRPQPRRRMLPVLLDEIAAVPPEHVVLINGLGSHRPNTDAELVEMLGREIVDKVRVVQHNAFDHESNEYIGRTDAGHDIWIDAAYIQADVKILTGFIEPHFFAGFSGGPKAVLPGIAAQASILANHSASMIGHPRATWGVTEGNPIWEEMREVALWTKPAFLYNATLNRNKQITGVFAGDLEGAHRAGTDFVTTAAMVPVEAPFDIVITSNSGYPLDLNLYQAIKGVSAAAQIVKPGGAIIVAAECSSGVADHAQYTQLLQSAPSAHALLEKIHASGEVLQDQWQVQIQAQVQARAEVYVKSSLPPADIEGAMLQVCGSIEETVDRLMERYGPDATICVLPEGPMTIPYLAPVGSSKLDPGGM
jgi:nickel-dependent lactate racemase